MNTTDLKRELFTICDSVIKGTVDPTEALQSIRNNVLEKDETLTSYLFDVIASFATLPLDGEHKEHATQFFKAVSHELLPDDALRLELSQLGADAFKSKIIKAKTKIYYKQLKFNLFREESEGYSKLVTELLTIQSKDNPDAVFERVSQLIGQFNLDPNRVVDLLIDCFACNFHSHRIFVRVLELFKIETSVLKKIILLKFLMLKKTGHTSNTVYRVVIKLAISGMIDIKEIFAAVQPTRDAFKETLKQQRRILAQRIKKAETISTLATIKIEESMSNGMSSALNESLSYMGSGAAGQARSFSSVTNVQEIEDKKAGGDAFDEHHVLGRNQKLGLLVAAAEMGSLNLVYQLIPYFPASYPLGSSKRLARGLCQILEYMLEPFYKQKHPPIWPDGTQPTTHWSKLFIERPECMTTWDELNTLILPLLKILGPYLGAKRETGLKLMCILSAFFNDEQIKLAENYQELSNLIYTIVDFCLLPSVSVGEPSFTYNEALWTILSRIPYQARYRMYGRWKSVHSADNYELQIQKGKVIGRMKYIMKRMTKETVKVAGRQLGKVCLTHPAIAFDYMLDRVQSFQNLIGPVVESMRYLSDLAFDVLSYSLIESLAQPSKQGLKTSDGTLSAWLVALATFAGAVYRRYTVEYEGILQYVTNQLKNEKSVDLMVLREVITATAGFEPINSLTADQLDALCNGDCLRQEIIGNTNQKGRRQAIARLRDALMRTDLCESLAILLAQQKDCIIYKEAENAPVKLASQMVDQCQETFIQFVNFLRSNIKPEEYVKRIPLITPFLTEYNLPAEAAFFLARFNYSTKTLNIYDALKKVEKESAETKKLDNKKKDELYLQALLQVFDSIAEELRQCMPEQFWDNLSVEVYTSFWLLSASDIQVNVDLYNREIERLRKERDDLHKADMSKTRRAREEERLKSLEQKLTQELSRQKDHIDRVISLITIKKETFFALSGSARDLQNMKLIQYCLLPRCVFSEVDAVYCAKFIITLHSLRTGFFNTLVIFDKIFGDIIPILLTLSENEGAAFGTFISLLLDLTLRWYNNKDLYETECAGFPGCLTKLRTKSNEFTFEDYRTVCFKWQLHLSRTLTKALSDQNSYVLVRNSFLLLNKILNQFPLITTYTTQIEEAATAVRDRERNKRLDLSVMAQSYLVHLKKRNIKIYEANEFHQTSVPSFVPAKPTSEKAPSKASDKSASNGKSTSTDKTSSSERRTEKPSIKAPSSSDKRSSSSDKRSTDKKSINDKHSDKKASDEKVTEKRSEKPTKEIKMEKKSEKVVEKLGEKKSNKRVREKTPTKERSSVDRKPASDKLPIEKSPTTDKRSVDKKPIRERSPERKPSNGRSASSDNRKPDKTSSADKKPSREIKMDTRPDKPAEKSESRSSRGSKRREPIEDSKQEPRSKRRYEK